jgi:DNA processing protein
MSQKKSARAALFASIEGGSNFWTQEIESFGVVRVYEKACGGGYDPIKYEKVLKRISTANPDQILSTINTHGAQLLTPEDEDWPIALQDLASPPIALVIKGSCKVLSERSLAIVGTRNPTNYGARIAADFAAGFVDR